MEGRNPEVAMSLLKKLFGAKDETVKRVRICVECGMPIEEHKDWCSIHRARLAMQQRPLKPVADQS
jgi:hypothetical protein